MSKAKVTKVFLSDGESNSSLIVEKAFPVGILIHSVENIEGNRTLITNNLNKDTAIELINEIKNQLNIE